MTITGIASCQRAIIKALNHRVVRHECHRSLIRRVVRRERRSRTSPALTSAMRWAESSVRQRGCWLNAGAPPAQIADRAGHSVTVLLSTYAHYIDGQDEITNRQIERALNTQHRRSNRTTSGATDRRSPPRSCPPYVRASGSRRAPRPARRHLHTPRTQASTRVSGHEIPQVSGQLPNTR